MGVPAFLAYMALMGVTGMLDHAGIRASLPGLYHAEHHDAHHELFTCNFGFPFVFLDIMHGTFVGSLWGGVWSGEPPHGGKVEEGHRDGKTALSAAADTATPEPSRSSVARRAPAQPAASPRGGGRRRSVSAARRGA